METKNWLVLLAFLLTSTNALIVPQELPSVLSLVYSTIPQVRKGTDSRVGFGFRLGEHADFQVLFELGPQKDTQPIGQKDSQSSNRKRNAGLNEFEDEEILENRPSKGTPNKESSSFLMNWSNDMITQKKTTAPALSPSENMKGINPFVQTSPLISEESLRQLQLLYKKAQSENKDAVTAGSELIDVTPRKNSNQNRGEQSAEEKAKIAAELMDVSME